MTEKELLAKIDKAGEEKATVLNLNGNQLTTLPEAIGQLTNLTTLNLNGNRLTTLPESIGQLTNLATLELSNNQLTTLPESIGQLTNLTELNLNGNELSTLPASIGQLTNLTELYLGDNQRATLPESIGQLVKLSSLHLFGNKKLGLPDEIVKKFNSPKEILDYYFANIHQGNRPLNECKLLVVGEANVGKTSIIQRLIWDKYDPHQSQTHGIERYEWLVQHNDAEIQLNVWDFGGQEIYHSTHQFFLTHRSIYVLVLNARVDEQINRVEYWLKRIQTFGGGSPVIVVCNKSDEHQLALDWSGLQTKYPQIKAFVRTATCVGDPHGPRGIDELRRLIDEQIADMPHIHDRLPNHWFTVKDKLNKLDKNYIDYCEYEELCNDEGVTTATSQTTLIDFLNDLGIVLHFRDHPILHDTNILNPEWVTDGVYRILNWHPFFHKNGVIALPELRDALPLEHFPEERHLHFVMQVMKRFELCFDFDDDPPAANKPTDKQFLVPALLPLEQPYTGDWDTDDLLHFEYRYDILLPSVMLRFIVRMNEYAERNTYWRKGILLQFNDGDNLALIKADIEDKIITVRIKGKPATRREFLDLIRSGFRGIHKTLPRLKAKEYVPVPGHPECEPISYNLLLQLEEKRIDVHHIEFGDDLLTVKVRDLLEGVSHAEDRSEQRAMQSEPDKENHDVGSDLKLYPSRKEAWAIFLDAAEDLNLETANTPDEYLKYIYDDHYKKKLQQQGRDPIPKLASFKKYIREARAYYHITGGGRGKGDNDSPIEFD